MKKIIYFSFISLIILIISCDESVITDNPGCTDKDACNYSLQFNLDDGSCQYPIENYNCDGNCIATIDCSGICGGDTVEDECEICGGDGIGNYDCDGNCISDLDCAAVCGGNTIEDECGVCGGNSTDISSYNCNGDCIQPIDCAGICGGDTVEDECGICGGDGIGNYDCNGNCITELDCAGVCGGGSVLDTCNVCNGSIQNIIECACPSGEIDSCGICGGPGEIYECGCSDIEEGFCDCEKEFIIDCDDNCCDPDWPFGPSGFDGNACYRIDLCGNCGDFISANQCQDDCKDCNGECGGDAIEDCSGECDGNAVVDCASECDGDAIEDECGVCSNNTLDSQYSLVWEDNFDGTQLNLEKWNVEEWSSGVYNEEEQAYTDAIDNIFLSNGQLHIRALREIYDSDGDGVADALYTSGRITTKDKGDWQYAKIEARAKLPIGDGTWPAIWMLPTANIYGDWPSSGEIDIMEFVGKDPGKTHSSIHNALYFTELDPNHPENDGMSQHQTSYINIDSVDSWHLYSMIWSKNRIIFYVDDVEVLIYDNFDTGFELWPFDQQFFLVLNLAIGGTWGGEVEPDIFPVEFVIDYVKVFQKSCGL